MIISFRNKQLSKLEAKIFYNLLKFGLYRVKFNDEEKRDYSDWLGKNKDKKEIMLTTERAKNKVIVPVNERGYLMEELYFQMLTHGYMKGLSSELKEMSSIHNPIDYKTLHDKFGERSN